MGHIKIDRQILDWEWYKDVNTKVLFLHCLLKSNWKAARFQGVDIPRGSFASSYQSLADETGLTVKQVRTALDKLKSTGEVAVKRHPKFSVITVKNYDCFQSEGSQKAEEGQSLGSERATIEEKKEINNKKKDPKGSKEKEYFVPPTLENVSGYCRENGYKVDAQRFIDFYASKGWMVGKNKMKDWRACVRNWARQDQEPSSKIIKTTGFSNFDQRGYDMDDLERQILESQGGGF